MRNRTVAVALACAGAASLLIPGLASAQPQDLDRVSGTEKGSFIAYSKVEVRWDEFGAVAQDTFISLTNDNNQPVEVQMYFVSGDDPVAADPDAGINAQPGWNWVDVKINLTQDQPVYWSALTGLPAGVSPWTVLDPDGMLGDVGPGRPANDGSSDRVLRGFIYAWAVDDEGCAIKWNHLAGNATIVNYADGAAWEYNTWGFQANDLDFVAGGPCGGLFFGGSPGAESSSGTGFAWAYDLLLFNFQAVGSTAFSSNGVMVETDTDVTLHPVSADLRQETEGPITTKASFLVWNENEVKFSGADRCITCWDQFLLSQLGNPNHFLLANLQTDHGKARVDGIDSEVVCGDQDPDTNDVSEAALLGVVARVLSYDSAIDYAGSNMFGMGLQSAFVLYDAMGSSPESQEQQDADALLQDAERAIENAGRLTR